MINLIFINFSFCTVIKNISLKIIFENAVKLVVTNCKREKVQSTEIEYNLQKYNYLRII